MLNSEMNYPYPVLRSEPGDYKTAIFSVMLVKEDREDGYHLKIDYSVNNGEIEKLIKSKAIAFALQIQCTSTWYRKIQISGSPSQIICIPAGEVHGKVELCPCIVALKELDNFQNSDFSEDFEGISFQLHKGDVVGIGDRYKFEAIYKDDIIKSGDSIVHVVKDLKSPVMHCEWEFETIQIHLPMKQYEQYCIIGEQEKWKLPVLNAIYVVPVIVQAISEIAKDELYGGDQTLKDYTWYKTLHFLMEKKANGETNKFRNLLRNPIKTAQILLDDNSSQSIEILSKTSKQLL